jgi:type I restriction enzyme R subunit
MNDYKTIAESNSFIVLDKYAREWKASESYQSESDLEREFIQDLVNQGYEYGCHEHA